MMDRSMEREKSTEERGRELERGRGRRRDAEDYMDVDRHGMRRGIGRKCKAEKGKAWGRLRAAKLT
jgi:hypothetical protein